MADFYNKADQKLFENYQYIPQEKYRLGLTLPTDATEDEVVTDEGIVNTNAFANAGGDGFSSIGNMFGEGTPVSPVYGSTPITGGLGEPGTGVDPVTGDIVGGGNIVDEFGIDGEVYPAGTFDNLESEEEVKQNFFSKLFNKAGQVKAGLPAALKGMVSILNPLSIVPTILGSIGSGGPQYGIAGLTDQQKNLYDSLAANNYLFNTPGGMKTFDGKNFSQFDQKSIDKYFDSKIDKFGSIKEYKDYLNAGGKKKDKTNVKNLLETLKFYELADKSLGDEDETTITNPTITPELINEFVNNNDTTDTPPGYDGSENEIPDDKIDPPAPPSYVPSPGDGGAGGNDGGFNSDNSSGYDGGNFCFDPSTPIEMADGSTKEIKNIQLGDATKGGDVTGVFQFKAADEIHDYKGVTVAGSHYVKEDGKFIMVKDSPLAVKINKIPVVYSLDTTGRRIFINDIEFADYNGDGVAKNFLSNAGVDLSGFDKEVLRQVEKLYNH